MAEEIVVKQCAWPKLAVELHYPDGLRKEIQVPEGHPANGTTLSLGYPEGNPYFVCVAEWGDPRFAPPPAAGFVEVARLWLPPSASFVHQSFIERMPHDLATDRGWNVEEDMCTCEDCRRA